MPINLDLLGKKTSPEPFTYTRDQIILYALGIGAGVEKELDFVYEKNLKVFPTFSVIPLTSSGVQMIIQLNVNPTAVLHGEHEIVLHNKIPPEGTLYLSTCLESIYDKGDKGAHATLTTTATNESEELIYKSKMLLVDRSAGHFGGERGTRPSCTLIRTWPKNQVLAAPSSWACAPMAMQVVPFCTASATAIRPGSSLFRYGL